MNQSVKKYRTTFLSSQICLDKAISLKFTKLIIKLQVFQIFILDETVAIKIIELNSLKSQKL